MTYFLIRSIHSNRVTLRPILTVRGSKRKVTVPIDRPWNADRGHTIFYSEYPWPLPIHNVLHHTYYIVPREYFCDIFARIKLFWARYLLLFENFIFEFRPKFGPIELNQSVRISMPNSNGMSFANMPMLLLSGWYKFCSLIDVSEIRSIIYNSLRIFLRAF